jgi:hypothetical protein
LVDALSYIDNFTISDNIQSCLQSAMRIADYAIGLAMFTPANALARYVIIRAVSLAKHAVNRIIDWSTAPAWISILNNINIGRPFYSHIGFSFSPTGIVL